MLRAMALLASLPVLAGCLGHVPFEPCGDESWPAWEAGSATVVLCVDGAERTAALHVPDDRVGDASAPLLVMLHGGGGSAQQLRSSSGMDAVADELGFAVLYADGTPAYRGAGVRTWNAMACCGRAHDRQTDDVAFLGTLLEGAIDRYPVDTARIGVAGHSNGAMMAYRLAAERSDLLTSVMPVAGAIGGRLDADSPLLVIPGPAQPVSVFILHATDDDHVPYDGGHGTATVDGPRIDTSVEDAVQFWLDADGCPRVGPTVSSTMQPDGTRLSRWDGCQAGTAVHVVSTAGGHGWPGSAGGVNPAPAEPDASRAIGGFLLATPRGPAP